MSKRGQLYNEVEPSDLILFLTWVQKKSHSKATTRLYALSLIDFYLTLREEGSLSRNLVAPMYWFFTQSSRAEEEQATDTSESLQLVQRVAHYLGHSVNDPALRVSSSWPESHFASPAQTGSVWQHFSFAPFNPLAMARQWNIRWLQGVSDISWSRWLIYLSMILLLLLFNYVPFLTTALQWAGQIAVDVITETPPVNRSRYQDSHVKRVDYFYAQQMYITFCLDVLHVNCQAAIPNVPLAPSWDNVVAGQSLFDQHCQPCHGSQGKGVGPKALTLPDPSSRLEFAGKGVLHKDIYLFWSIFEGGNPLNTSMPSFKNVLTENEIWQIILFINSL
ncbi:MAG: cytochrome c [Magnetococcus sp. YQC-5]